MSNPQQLLPADAARNVLVTFFDEIRLARATEMAQSERFADAEAVLMENGRLPETARELDLLARMAARQGRFAKARELWTKASQLEPQNPAYQQCIKSLTVGRQLARIIAAHEGKLWNLLIVAVVVFIGGLLVFVFRK